MLSLWKCTGIVCNLTPKISFQQLCIAMTADARLNSIVGIINWLTTALRWKLDELEQGPVKPTVLVPVDWYQLPYFNFFFSGIGKKRWLHGNLRSTGRDCSLKLNDLVVLFLEEYEFTVHPSIITSLLTIILYVIAETVWKRMDLTYMMWQLSW